MQKLIHNCKLHLVFPNNIHIVNNDKCLLRLWLKSLKMEKISYLITTCVSLILSNFNKNINKFTA